MRCAGSSRGGMWNRSWGSQGVFAIVPWGSCYCGGSRRRTGENDGMRSVREVVFNRSGKGGLMCRRVK